MKQKLIVAAVAVCFSLSMHASGRVAQFLRKRGGATQVYQLRTAEQQCQSFDEKFGQEPWFKELQQFRSPLVVFAGNRFKRGRFSHRVGNVFHLRTLGDDINGCLGN